MTTRIPDDAFERYVAMGPNRSYQALAEELDVSKRAITKKAAKDGWTERLERIESAVQQKTDQKIAETLEAVRDRHLKTIRAMHSRALTGLKQFPLTDGMQALKAAELTIKLERLVLGESTERTETIEEITRREIQDLLVIEGDGSDG